MHTLSLFPSLLTFGLFAPLVLRLAVSYFLFSLGNETYKKEGLEKWYSIFYFITALFIFVGFYTQAFVLVGILVIKFDWWTKKKISPISKEQMMLYVFAEVILLSLVVTGPGAFAIDLPL